MSERMKPEAASRAISEEPEEARLRALYAAAYVPVKPSAALQRRVAALMAPDEAWMPSRCTARRARRLEWVPVATLAVALLAVLGLMLARASRDGARRYDPPHIASRPAPVSGSTLPSPDPKPRRSRHDHASASSPAVSIPHAEETAPPIPRSRGADRGRPAALNPIAPPGTRRPRRAVDDLTALNDVAATAGSRWELDARHDRIEERLRRAVPVRDDFVRIPFPRLASAADRQIAEAAESYQREAAIVDPRLTHGVTLQQKAMALSDLCERMRGDTGVQLTAGASVADEKVTLFCEKLPLREVMRQLSRPFGYTWLRSGKQGEYRYELVQDLRSQLLEEELRNRDRNEALLALDREMQPYRPYLSLSPDEALARSKTAPPAEKPLLEKLGNKSWGPIQMYFRLSPSHLQKLRSGQTLVFAAVPRSGEQQSLPSELGRGVLECLRDVGLIRRDGGYDFAGPRDPGRLALTAVPEASARVRLFLNQRELGRFTLDGASGVTTGSGKDDAGGSFSDGPIATGMSHAILQPENASANARLARDPALRTRVTVSPQSYCVNPSPSPSPNRGGKQLPLPGEVAPPKLTAADVLEALHRATGLPIVANYYTRLYQREDVAARNQPLFDTLNQLADAMRLRWDKEGPWLRFRSTSYYDDRLKEVPNRLLTQWAASRREHGALTLDELIEISQLSDAQLDAADMAEGARDCFGLKEWDVARDRSLRPHLHYLEELTPGQRQEAQSATGLAFGRMSLAQQQRYIALAFGSRTDDLQSLQELSGATLRLAYTQPGGFEWRVPGPPGWREMQPSPVRERNRVAALQAARRLHPQVEAAEIVPTELAVELLYACSQQLGGYVNVIRTTSEGSGGYDGRPRIDPDLAQRSLTP
jgi:hypothetical protein